MGFAALVYESSQEEFHGSFPFFLIAGGALCFLLLLAAGIVGLVLFLTRNQNRDNPSDTR